MPTTYHHTLLDEIREAYLKYKSYVYYDSSELFQREKLAEYERYDETLKVKVASNKVLEKKLSALSAKIDFYNDDDDDDDIESTFGEIGIHYLPKTFTNGEKNSNKNNNFITNVRVEDTYELEQVIVMANLLVEWQLISVLWIMRYGRRYQRLKDFINDCDVTDNLYRATYLVRHYYEVHPLVTFAENPPTDLTSNDVAVLSEKGATTRDLHCYIAQVNTSQYGDSRITQPTISATKNILKLKGGTNNTILSEDINITKLRNFQLKTYERTKHDVDNSFKPLPPDWNREAVDKRVKGEFVVGGVKKI